LGIRGITNSRGGEDSTAMKVVSVLSLKGGVGKTSVVLGLASAATVRGLATLVIDLDPQGNATSILAADEPEASAADVIAHPTRATIESALTPCAWEVGPGEVDVIPSSPELITHDAFKTESGFHPRLVKAIEKLSGYDLVLIDCPPSLGALTREALSASDLALVVATPNYFALQGAQRAADEIASIRRLHNRKLKLVGVLPNRVKSVAEEHDYRIRELGQIFGRQVLRPAIPERIALQQAEGFGKPVHTLGTAGSREVSAIFDKHLTHILRG
jgi:chromosome partitioning protein